MGPDGGHRHGLRARGWREEGESRGGGREARAGAPPAAASWRPAGGAEEDGEEIRWRPFFFTGRIRIGTAGPTLAGAAQPAPSSCARREEESAGMERGRRE